MTTEITSLNNDIVKETVKLQQKKYREESKKFLLEGYKPIQEAHSFGLDIEKVFVLSEKAEKYSFLNDKLILTTDAVLKKISTTDTAPEAVAVAKQKKYTITDLKNAKKILLLENIKDAGNLGTILRTAKAFSIDAVILFGDVIDLYNPKCVRSAVGNLWKTPVANIKSIDELKQNFPNHEIIATLPKADDTIFLNEFKSKEPYIILFGSEADGLSHELIEYSDKKVTIEMDKNVESLNLAISVGVVLYKLAH